jgi:uncharacterized phage-like protein YoqJ
VIICGTGHRPQDLPCGFAHKHPWKKEKLGEIKRFLTENKANNVISGMCIGFDQWLAHVALSLDMQLSAYCPFRGQELRWQEIYQNQYREMLLGCINVRYVCKDGYAAWKMQKRNEAMINDSDLVLALWNPEKQKGGTFNAVSYALKIKKPVINIWGEHPEDITYMKLGANPSGNYESNKFKQQL